jgi:hypothetical protein
MALAFAMVLLATSASLAFGATINESEINDTVVTANAINVGDVVRGTLASNDPVNSSYRTAPDFFKFSVTTTGFYTIEFTHAAQPYDATFATVEFRTNTGTGTGTYV